MVWKNKASAAPTLRQRALKERLLDEIRGTSFAYTAPLLCQEIYSIARTAFRTGQVDLGRRGMVALRAQGYSDHPGRPLHRVAARLLGLETKVRLWGG